MNHHLDSPGVLKTISKSFDKTISCKVAVDPPPIAKCFSYLMLREHRWTLHSR